MLEEKPTLRGVSRNLADGAGAEAVLGQTEGAFSIGLLADFVGAECREKECRGLLDELRETGAATMDRCYEPGAVILKEGEPGGALYFLTEGVARLVKTYSNSKEATPRLLTTWDVFGDVAFGGEVRQQARVEAVTACKVVKVPKPFLERVIRSRPEAALKLMTLLEFRLVQYQDFVQRLLPRRTEARLASLLMTVVRGTSGERNLCPYSTPADLAQMVASTRESVSSVLKDLRRRGVLRTDRGRIVVLKPDELAKIAVSTELYG